jgi:hypothetical protein
LPYVYLLHTQAHEQNPDTPARRVSSRRDRVGRGRLLIELKLVAGRGIIQHIRLDLFGERRR